MSCLIVYMSRHGTTRKVAHELKEKLGSQKTMLVDLEKEEVPNLAQFDTVIIGGSIHAGKIQAGVRKFCERNLDALLKKRVGLFLCYMDKVHAQKEFDDAFPEQLREHASAIGMFGGELLFDHMNFLEKLVVKAMTGEKKSVSNLDEESIDRFGRKLHD
jgi:menaquinone-dependent protoporphyrinogen oxidase